MAEPKTPAGRRIADLVAAAEVEAAEQAQNDEYRVHSRKFDQIARIARQAIERGEREGASYWREGLSRIRQISEPGS